MTANGNNRQVRKTRAAVLDAFNDFILEGRYADIRVGDIIRRADVGRSTFYEHFRSKEDVLRASLSSVMSIVADAVRDDCDRRRLEWVVEHFRENGRLARSLLNGTSASQVVGVLAGLIEERLDVLKRESEGTPIIPLALVAAQVAEAQLGLVRAWLNRGATCPAAAIATAMHRSATALSLELLSRR